MHNMQQLQQVVGRVREWRPHGRVWIVNPRRLLPAPRRLTTEEQLTQAQRFLGVRLLKAAEEAAVVASASGNGGRLLQAVGIHENPFDLMEAFQSGVGHLTVLNRAVPVDLSPLLSTLRKAREELPGEEWYQKLLDLTEGWLTPDPRRRSAPPPTCREALIWAPWHKALPKVGGETTALVHGKVVSLRDFGDVLWATLTRIRDGKGDGGELPPLLAGCPSAVFFEEGHYRLGGSGQCFGIWSLVPRLDRLVGLFELDVDVLAHLENVDRQLYVTVLVRAAAESPQGLGDLEDRLRTLGRVERVPGWHPLGCWDLPTAFRSFVPGGAPPSPQNRFSVRPADVLSFLGTLAGKVGMADAQAHDLVVGRSTTGQRPVTFERAQRPVVAVEGPTGSGKTMLASFLALTGTPHIVVVHCTSVEGEASSRWAVAMGGQCLDLTLPSAQTPKEFDELVKADAAEVEQLVAKMKGRWLKSGHVVGLPIVLRRDTGCPYRFIGWARQFLVHFSRAWAEFAERHPNKKAAIIIDDIAGVGGTAEDPFIGDRAVNVGVAFREEVRLLIDTVRKRGIELFVTVHSREEFRTWAAGTWRSFTLCIELPADVGHRSAHLWYPPEVLLTDPVTELSNRRGYLGTFDPQLPRPIVEMLSRKETK